MGLFDFKNHELKLKPEAMILATIKAVWDRDKSKNKARAYKELSFIYFVYDPRSDYQYITEIVDRQAKVAGEMGLGEDFIPDNLLLAAINTYIDSTNTVSSGLLNDTYFVINKAREFLRNVEIEDVDAVQKVIKTLDAVPSLVEKVIKTKQLVSKELDEEAKMRGQRAKKIMEDGLTLD